MAEYKGIKGFKVQYLSADPSDPIIGQTWYNSTSKDLKFTGFQAAGWATGNNMNTARWALAGAGTQTAAHIMAGFNGSSYILASEFWNGTSMSTGASTANDRGYAHSTRTSTPTGAYLFGGYGTASINATEEYSDAGPATKTITVS